MADQFIAFDPDADEGERLAPEVRTEVAYIAPSAVLNGSITTAKLADLTVTTAKIDADAVTTVKIVDSSVTNAKLASDAVSTTKIAANSVTPPKVGTGVVTATDSAGATVATTIKYVTAAQYAGLTPDPNTLYFISA